MGKSAADEKTGIWREIQKSCRVIIFVPFLLTACHHVTYSTERQNFLSDSTENQGTRTLGNIYVNYNDSDVAKPYTMEFNRYRGDEWRGRQDKGYTFNAPLYDNADDTRLHYTVAKTKERKWFSGLEMKFEF
jgi:hypothetical protein